jgi:polysaccharide chain length determinant protein (PEP-CTERM system associated)
MQQPHDSLTVARRAMDVEDYIDVLRRHKAWIFGPMFAALVLSVVAAFLWPDTYASIAVVRIVPSQVPERYVASNINTEMSQRVSGMAEQILSRATLTDVITTLGLYPKKVKRVPMEDVIEAMRRDIHIGSVASREQQNARISAFPIVFDYENRFLAQKVVQAILSKFMDENTRSRSEQSAMTTEFLKDKWESARKDLEELETKLTTFRMKNAGKLPEQLQSNLQQLNTLTTQLAASDEAVSRANQTKTLLETQLRTLKDQLAYVSTPSEQNTEVAATAKNERLMQLERDIVKEEAALEGMRQHYTDSHPDVRYYRAQITLLKEERDKLLKEEEQKKPEPPPPTTTKKKNPADPKLARSVQADIDRLQTEIQNKNTEIDERLKDHRKINDLIKVFQARIESSPYSQQEYETLMRDYTLAKVRYEELNGKKNQSETATDLENQKRGETLEVLDPPSLPETPEKPNRWMIVGAGLGIGLVLGFFVSGAREMKDTALKNLKDVRAYTNLPVLGSIPLLENDLVVRRKRRLAWLAWSATCLIGAVAMAGSVYYHYATRS